MDKAALESAITFCLKEVRDRLDGAARTARAAEACAQSGDVAAAVEVGMDLEQAVYEATRLFDAASHLNKLLRDG